KRLYQKVGGYRALTDMEDADIVRRIGRRRLVGLRARAINVARPHPNTLRGFVLTSLHTLRIPSGVLAKLSLSALAEFQTVGIDRRQNPVRGMISRPLPTRGFIQASRILAEAAAIEPMIDHQAFYVGAGLRHWNALHEQQGIIGAGFGGAPARD